MKYDITVAELLAFIRSETIKAAKKGQTSLQCDYAKMYETIEKAVEMYNDK